MINKYFFITSKEARDALDRVKSIKAKILGAKEVITPTKYKSKFVREQLHGEENKEARQERVKKSKIEKRVFRILENNGYRVLSQFVVLGYFYDIYIEGEDILIEVDGEFWHPESLTIHNYKSQFNNYVNDITKNVVAMAKKKPLIRIRENFINDSTDEEIITYIEQQIPIAREKILNENKTI